MSPVQELQQQCHLFKEGMEEIKAAKRREHHHLMFVVGLMVLLLVLACGLSLMVS